MIQYFNIHEIAKIKITRNRRLPFGWFIDRVYDAYKVETLDDPNLIITVGTFTPDLENTVLVNGYYIRENFAYTEMRYKGAVWKVEIEGLEKLPFKVRLSLNTLGAIGFSSTTITNLVKLMFFLQGYASIHGACFSNGEQAVLYPARSGVGKTLLSLHMLKKDYKLLGDDKVFLKEDTVVSHLLPINLKFTYAKLPDIHISLFEKFSIYAKKYISILTLGYLKLLTPTSLKKIFPGKTVSESRLAKLCHMISGEDLEFCGAPDGEAFIRQTVINSKIEATELCVLIDAYRHVFPSSQLGNFWTHYSRILGKCLAQVPVSEMIVPEVFTEEAAQLLEQQFNRDNA